ncbi:MAG TPA: hypothetical protein VGQ30_02055 [Gemmatimonadaceae bacterium]|nr:hypothetical protein [Gemmatimonadaceae bacterium]
MANELTPSEANDSLALRREDLASVVKSYQGAIRGRKEWAGVAAGFTGFPLALILMAIRERAGWPESLDKYFFFLGWTVFLSFLGVVLVRARRIRKRYEIRCPACDVSLLGPPSSRGGVTFAELAIATGNCPSCGAHILAP